MANVASSITPAAGLSWDGEGRRVSGGPLAPDLEAPPGEEFTFSDFLSVINPLQHIPVVSSLYRWATGDTIKPVARVVGGALYGGPIGLVTAVFNAVVEQVKGADIGAQALAMVMPDKGQGQGQAQTAAAPMVAPEPAAVANAAPAPDGDREADNLAALQLLAADLRNTTPEPAEPKPAEPPAVAPLQPGQPRTLAYYQANAGRRLSAPDTSRYVLPQQFVRPAPVAVPIPPAPGAAPDKHESPDAARIGEGSPDAWFTSAMRRGLDRYRTMQQLDKGTPQVDLSH
jgi:hypothetical protein